MEIKIHEGKIELVDISVLKSRKGNRNSHPQDQINRLAEIYKYQGFRNPIIVSNQSGEIVCGTGRFLAAIRAGLKQVPVLFQDYDSTEQEYAHHVADNALSLWSDLDFKGINLDLPDLGPEFSVDFLGIKDFTLDVFDKNEFDPSENDDDDNESDEKEKKRCPHCGGAL